MDVAVEMARLAVAEGITHVVCTPHANSYHAFDPRVNAAKADELRARLAAEKIDLTLGLGCDFHLSLDNVELALADPARYSINGLGYLLVEAPNYGLPPGLSETFYRLRLAGMTPVLTHPERNATLQQDPERLIEWLRAGLLVQVTADSLTGHKGRRAQQVARQLLDRRWVHFLATDAHNTTTRPPRMRAAYELVGKRYGAAYAYSLCVSNPQAAYMGRPFEIEGQPRGLEEVVKTPTWWQRMTAALMRK